MDRRRREVSSEESMLWRDAMKGVTPFPGRLPTEQQEAPSPPAAQPAVRPPSPPAPLPDRPRPAAAPHAALGHGHSPGLDKRTLLRLKKGEIPVEASIDLHGLTQDAAHAALWRFITGAAEQGRRCLLVITGKGLREGTGVLRVQVPRWLNEATIRPLVLAFASARPKDGGEGALYILLKRRR